MTATDHIAKYRQMLLIRRFDETVLELRAAGAIDGVVHPYIGQEAIAVGVCGCLRHTDGLTSTHRGHGHCIAKGADPRRMMAELFGRRDGYCGGKGGSMHIADFEIGMLGANGIVAAGLPIATGAALAATLAGTDGVAVCMFGEGAAGAGPFHESMNVAALWRLPVIFVCENNQWAQSTPADAGLSAQTVSDMAAPYGVVAEIVDGNDVLAVEAAAHRAVDRARLGEGPTLLEAKTFRMGAHAYRGPAPPEQRDPELLAAWRARDPILAFGERMIAEGTVKAGDLKALAHSVDDEIEDALAFARQSPFPELDEAYGDVFAPEPA